MQIQGTRQRLQGLMLKIKHLPALKKWKDCSSSSYRRYRGILELVKTQEDYHTDLTVLQQKVAKPMLHAGIISQQEEKQMFPNVQGMIKLSQQMFSDANKLSSQWDPHKTVLGLTMIRYSKFLQIYSQFFKSYSKSRDKLKALLQRQEVREIQKKLQGQRTKTFEDLYSKPFQRSLKYKLILVAYGKQLKHYRNHPDTQGNYSIEHAITCYEQVGHRNNKAMQNKEKSATLLSLQQRFPGIIDNQAKYYINTLQATMIDTTVNCHILSNMLLITNNEDKVETEMLRIIFDQNSFLVALPDGVYLKNRLYICGKRRSIHLCFKKVEELSECEKQVQKVIEEIYRSYQTRVTVGGTIRQSVKRDSIEQVRSSYTQLKEVLPRPPRLLVLGQIRRRYTCPKTYTVYFVIKFQLPFGVDNCQYLYVDYEELLALQSMLRSLYPFELKDLPWIEQPSKMVSAPDIKANSVRSLQYKSVHATVLLNYLFRHPQLAKRSDIVAQRLQIAEPLWLYCRYGMNGCACHFCCEGQVLLSLQSYERELIARRSARTGPKTFFCPFRTVHAQNMIAQLDICLLERAVDRLLVLQCERGRTDYRVADTTPGFIFRKKITVRMEGIEGGIAHDITIDRQRRVGQIIEEWGQRYNMRMEDHQLLLKIGKNSYILGRDEVLWQVLDRQSKAEESIFSFFKTAFGEKEDLSFRLELQKVWVLEADAERSNKNEGQRVALIVQQFMLRLRNQEIKLSIEDTSNFYACYFIFKNIGEQERMIEQSELKSLIAHKKWKAMEVQQRAQILDIVQTKVQKLRGKLTQAQILNNIWKYTINLGQNCPGWSAYYFDAQISSHPQYPQGFPVRIGADLKRLYVRQSQKMTSILQFQLSTVSKQLIFSSWQLHITTDHFNYIFIGDCLFHLQEVIQSYALYSQLLAQ